MQTEHPLYRKTRAVLIALCLAPFVLQWLAGSAESVAESLQSLANSGRHLGGMSVVNTSHHILVLLPEDKGFQWFLWDRNGPAILTQREDMTIVVKGPRIE